MGVGRNVPLQPVEVPHFRGRAGDRARRLGNAQGKREGLRLNCALEEPSLTRQQNPMLTPKPRFSPLSATARGQHLDLTFGFKIP